MKKVTIKDIASMANVSVTTVSLVLNDKPSRIRPETKAKIIQLAKEHHYMPNIAARSLVGSRTDTIGLIISNLGEPINAAAVQALSQQISKSTSDLVLYETFSDWRDVVYKKLPQEGRVDGIIHKAFDLQSQDHLLMSKLEIPIVIYENQLDCADCVVLDNEAACETAIRYLLRKGHQHIGAISCVQYPEAMNVRLDSIRNTLRESGLVLDPNHVFHAEQFSPQCGVYAANYFDRLTTKPTAIFSIVGDYVAIGFLKKIKELGYRVPDDFAVVGFDDLWFSSFLEPNLTTLHQPLKEMASTATELLFARIEDPNRPFQTIKFNLELIIRESA